MNKNKVRLNIYSSEYVICSDETPEYVSELGSDIDDRLSAIMKNNPRISVIQATVLLALEYADKAKKNEKGIEKLRSQIKDYLEDASAARMESELAKREAERLARENEALRLKMSGNNGSSGRY
ncbi:MAG: cell division protein ZapA [Clostridia bacterium]|nr:cell division protein ZapA [Clostridia bacterium]MBQ6707875.1 cell division protein ZapA [Clostridia bacterium]